jgi:hypothetical protein
MAAASDYLELKLLDHVLRNTSYSSPAAVYCSLHTGSPGDDDGGGNEVGSGVGYTRQAITNSAAASGQIANSAILTFGPCSTTDWGVISHIGIYDNSTGGQLLFHGAVTTTKNIQVGDSFQIAVGNLIVTLA